MEGGDFDVWLPWTNVNNTWSCCVVCRCALRHRAVLSLQCNVGGLDFIGPLRPSKSPLYIAPMSRILEDVCLNAWCFTGVVGICGRMQLKEKKSRDSEIAPPPGSRSCFILHLAQRRTQAREIVETSWTCSRRRYEYFILFTFLKNWKQLTYFLKCDNRNHKKSRRFLPIIWKYQPSKLNSNLFRPLVL